MNEINLWFSNAMKYLPNVAVLVGKDAQEEFTLAVGDASLRDNHVVSRRQCKERHHFPCHWVIGYIQRFLVVHKTNKRIKVNDSDKHVDV